MTYKTYTDENGYITCEGKAGIVAKVIAHSASAVNGKEILTFEVQYPRLILSELNTHRMLSKNSASSRAIPFKKMCEQLTARPVRFGQTNPGMQDKGEDYNASIKIGSGNGGFGYMESSYNPGEYWDVAKRRAIEFAKGFHDAGYAKQIYNRLVEPFQMVKTIITATEWNNFFWLRDDDAADPTIAELARCMKAAKDASVAQVLEPGEWHLPYVWSKKVDGCRIYGIASDVKHEYHVLSLEDAIKVSSARCAAVSFRNTDYDLEKSIQVYERLVGDERKHASALEHQATPMVECSFSDLGEENYSRNPDSWQTGISHTDRDGNLWSGNFCGWLQHRKLIAGENKAG